MSTLNEKAARRRFEARELLDKLKSGSCKDCNNTFLPCQMDFVRNDGRKGPPISQMLLKSKKTIMREAEKCVLVCANCGRLRTWKSQRAKRSEPV
jgi:hypothetical protein